MNALQYKNNSSGIGVMIRELFGSYTRISGRECRVILPNDGPEFPVCGTAEAVRIPWNYKQHLRRMFFQTFQMGRRYCKSSVLITVDSKTPLLLPKDCMVIPIVTDLAVYRMKESYQLSRVLWWRLQYWFLRKRADSFLAISEFTKNEIMRLWNIPESKIHVVPCACSKSMKRVTDQETLNSIRKKYRLDKEYMLFVGNFNPRKNLERLIKAYSLAKKEYNIPYLLVIAGQQGWKFDKEAALKNAICKEDIRFIGFVPDGDMPALYSGAAVFIFTTLYEGFGIPVIEAQKCGVPVLTSRVSALPETGGDAAVYVDPYDERDICRGMMRILDDPSFAVELREKGYENAKRFSWERSAGILKEIIDEVTVK